MASMTPRRDRSPIWSPQFLPWASLALWLPLALAAAVHLWWNWGFSGVRLVRSLGWLYGESLFPGPGEGWIQIALYGPGAAAAFLPAVWAPTPALAIAIGQVLAAIYYFVPALLLIHLGTGARGAGLVTVFALFAALSLDLWSLRYVSLTVHADGPAIALGALAAWNLLRRRSGPALGAAAGLAVAAVWTKQVAIGLPLALAVFVAAVYGWRALLRFAAWGMAWSGLSWAVVWWIFGSPENVLFHLVHVPGQHSWRWDGGLGAVSHSTLLFVSENLALVAMTLVAGLLAVLTHRRSTMARDDLPWALMLWIAVCQLPLALIGRAKIGGDANAYSHSLYFLLLGTALLLWRLANPESRDGDPATETTARWSRRLLIGAPPLILLAVASVQQRAEFGELRDRFGSPHPYTVAAGYAAAHPGTVYFPRMNLVTGLVEGRLDHQIEGLYDLINAGHAPSAAHFHERMPPRLEKVAILVNSLTDQVWVLEQYLELERLPDDPELPGFWLFRATPRASPIQALRR